MYDYEPERVEITFGGLREGDQIPLWSDGFGPMELPTLSSVEILGDEHITDDYVSEIEQDGPWLVVKAADGRILPPCAPAAPIVPKKLIRGVSERVDCFGEVVVPLNEKEAEEALQGLLAQGVEAIAICFLWSFKKTGKPTCTAPRAGRCSPRFMPARARSNASMARTSWPRYVSVHRGEAGSAFSTAGARA